MAKSRPTQSVLKGVTKEGFVLAQRKDGIQNVNLDVVFPGKEVRDVMQATQEFIQSKNLPLTVVSYYCQVARKGEVPSLNEWAEATARKVPPGDKYFALVVADSANKVHERHLFKIKNGVPVEENLAAITESEFHKLALSSRINTEETYNVTTTKDNGPAHMPTVSQDSLQPVRDTEVPTSKDKISSVEKQVDTEVPTRASEIKTTAPQSQSGFSSEEIAAAEFGIPPAGELQPSNTSQLFRDDVPMKKSSDSTLMPIEETDYSTDRTEKGLPVPSLSPSQTTIQFKNDTPIKSTSDDDFQLSDEEFDLSDKDSEAVIDLEGELGDTKFLSRTPTGKLVKPDSGEKFLDASTPSLNPLSDTEIIPALPQGSAEDYFGSRDEDDDSTANLRGLTKVEVPVVPGNLSGILGKRDIPAISKLSFESEGVGDDTELNMPRVEDDFGRKTEHLPPPQKVSEIEDGIEDLYVLDAPKGELKQTVQKESPAPEGSHARAMKVISKLKDAGWDFDEHGRPARKSVLSTGKNGLSLSNKLLQVLSKGNISQNDLILIPRIKMQGDDEGLYERILEIAENPDKDLRKKMLKVYDEQVKHNSELSDDEKSEFYNAFIGREPKPRVSWFKRTAIAAGIASAAFIAGHFTVPQLSNNSDLEGKLAQVTTERDSINSKYEKLSNDYKSVVGVENDLKRQLEEVKNEKSTLEEKMKSSVSKEEFDSLSKQYESLKLEEQKIREQIENLNKEKSSLESLLDAEKKNSKDKDSLLESQKSEYESQLSQKDALLKELNEKYSSYVPKETLDEIVKKNSEYEIQISELTKELDSLKAEVKKYESLGEYEDVKALVDKQNKQQKVARNSDEVYKIFLSQLERYSVTDDELYRHIACANLTKAAIRSGEEAQVWLAFMRLVDRYETKDFGSTKEQSALVAAKLMEAAAVEGKFDDSSVDSVVERYKKIRGQKSSDKSYDRKCLSAAESTEQHFMTNK